MDPCPTCAAPNPRGFLFCGQCGASLPAAACPSCGATITDGQRFCGQCGAAVLGASVPLSAVARDERKLATVLFADVVGFTSLAERTDAEVVARLVDAAFRELGDIVVEHGGVVDKYMGDSVMAVFGVPISHDDDAERAVAAAMAMRHLGGDLVFSIGVNSGEVMATAVGAGAGVTVIGDTVNVAARLEKAAGPGEVLCGRLTTELTGGRIAFRARQPILLKGKKEPVEVWEAVSLQPLELQPSVAAPPLVGRDDELAFLEAQWRRVCRDRQPQVVVVCGDAGSGKTRLTSELARTAEVDGTVVRSTYPAYGAMGGARVAAEVIRQLGPVDDADVTARVRSLAGELDESLQSIDPAGMHQEQLWGLGRLLQEKGAERPLLILIDDMHRSGDQMLKVLGELSGRLDNVPLLTVLAGRSDPGEWLGAFPAATTVRLGPLSRSDAIALAGGFACGKPLADEAADFLVDRAGGNPLYLRELVSMARAQGLLVDDGDQYRLTAHGAVPATLQALLAARLDALEPEQKLVLQHAAVMGGATARAARRPGVAERAGRIAVPGRQRPHAPRRRRPLRHRGLAAARGRLRDPAPQRARRAPSPRRGHRGRTRGAGPPPRSGRRVPGRRPGRGGRGGRGARPRRRRTCSRPLATSMRCACSNGPSRWGAGGPPVLLDLAKVQTLCGKHEDAFKTLAMVRGRSRRSRPSPSSGTTPPPTPGCSRDPAVALPRLEAVTERWQRPRGADKEAWGHANMGVTYFNLSRMEEAARELELRSAALRGDRRPGRRGGGVVVPVPGPTHRPPRARMARAGARVRRREPGTGRGRWARSPRWRGTTSSDRCGARRPTQPRPRDSPAGWRSAGRGARRRSTWPCTARSLLAITARFSGRLDEAARHAEALAAARRHRRRRELPVARVGGQLRRRRGPRRPPTSRHRSPPAPRPTPWWGWRSWSSRPSSTVSGRVEEALARFDVGDAPRPRALRRSRRRCSTAWRSCWRVEATRPCPGSSAPPGAARALDGAIPPTAAAAALAGRDHRRRPRTCRPRRHPATEHQRSACRCGPTPSQATRPRSHLCRDCARTLAMPGLLLGL